MISRKAMLRLGSAMAWMLLVTAGLALAGCGGEEKAPAPAEDLAPAKEAIEEAVEEAEEAVEQVEKAIELAVAPDAPVALQMLRLTPESAQMSVGLPPLNGVVMKLLALDEKLSAVDIEGQLDEYTTQLANNLDVPDAQSLEDIAEAKGITLDKPMGLWVDLNPMVDSVVAALEKAQAEMESAEEPAEEAAEESEEAAAETPAEQKAAPEMKVSPEEMDTPAWVLALGLSDEAKAKATLEEVIATTGLDLTAKEEVKVGPVTLQAYDEYGYTMTGGYLMLGSLELLKGVAGRIENPAEVRYGTEACPATALDEAAALVYGNRLMPLLKKVLPVLELPPEAQMLESQMAMLDALLAGEEEDPAVATLAWTDEKLELLSRISTETHPKLAEISGTPKPLRLSRLLPKETVGMIAFGLTPEYKKYLMEQTLNAVPPEMKQDPAFAQGMTYGQQVMEMLGSEVTLGVAPRTDDLPLLALMVNLANPEATKGLIQMLASGFMLPGETYKDVEISIVTAPIPIELNVAFPEDIVLITSGMEETKQIIDRLKGEETSGLFTALEPPLDPELPRFSAVVLDSKLLTDVVLPTTDLMPGAMPPEIEAIMDQVTSALKQVRLVNEVRGEWQASALSLYLTE